MLRKFSSLLLRGHHFLERRLAKNQSPAPRVLHYKQDDHKPGIVHFNGNFVIGGTSQLIADIVERTSGNYSHRIFVPDHPEPLPYQPLSIKKVPLGQMAELHRELEQHKPSLVHIHYWVRPMHRYFDFGLWYKAVFEICETLELKVIQNIDVPTNPYQAKNIVHNVFVSNYVRNEFNNASVPSSVIYPGSDMQHFSNPGTQRLPDHTIGMVYRLDRDKLDENAIEIFIAAVKKKPSLHCYIIGGGYYMEHYKKRVKEENQQKNFTFTGYVSYEELPAYYKKLGLIVAPVHDESFGQVTPFAMAMGLPIAGYDTGAMCELLGSKENLVPTGNVQALAQLIVNMMEDREGRYELGIENRKRAAANFSLEKMITDYEALYKSQLS